MKRYAIHISFTVAALLALAFSGCSGGSPGTLTSSSPSNATSEPASSDIVRSGDGAVLGSGWYAREEVNGTPFRWANNDAEITACPDVNDRTMAIYMEPGPGAGKKPLPVIVAGNRGDKMQILLQGRHYVKVTLAKGLPAETFAIHVTSPNLPAPHDSRTLNFRAFSILLGSSINDCKRAIINDGSQLQLGSNWYAYEMYNGQSFRWVNNNAQVRLTAVQARPFTLELFVEPGPSLGGSPLRISVLDAAGKSVAQSQPIPGQSYTDLQLPAAPAGTVYTLHVSSKNVPVPHDKRTLNFRVFNVKIKPPVS